MCSGWTSNDVKSEYSTGSAGQGIAGSRRGSLQSPVNFSDPKALNQIFNLKLNSKINIKVEWLWNPLDSFVICFRYVLDLTMYNVQ